MGCPIDLKKNVEGITTLIDTALHHIESEHEKKHTLVRVLRVQQQVITESLIVFLFTLLALF